MATKTSILLFYLTLAKANKAFKWMTLATMLVVDGAGLALTFLNVFQCSPIGAVFTRPVPSSAQCQDLITLYLSSAPVNIITDLIILFLPLPILTGMRLPRKQKIILIVTFSFGLFVAVVDVIRIAYLQEAATRRIDEQLSDNSDGGSTRNSTDTSWNVSLSFMWSAVEVNVGIMCACVPGLKPLVSRFLPRMIREVRDRTGSFREDEQEKSFVLPEPSKPFVPHSPRSFQAPSLPSPGLQPAGGNHEASMDIFEFLTTPESMTSRPDLTRQETAMTFQTLATVNTAATNRSDTGTYFDFVKMDRRKSFDGMTNAESIVPITLVTVLFFVWGVAYGFLDTLNTKFQSIAGWDAAQTISIHCAYFGSYFLASLTFGRWTLQHYGFKACFMVGLILYSSGSLVFWPSAVLGSLPAFIISNIVVGMGLATLEIASNPFVALCGPQEYMEMRLNLAQGVQAVGTVVSPLLATKVLFNTAIDAPALVDVQWTYLAIGMFAFLLAVIYYYLPLPEASRTELARLAPQQTALDTSKKFAGVKVIWITLAAGVISLFLYVGNQESTSTSFSPFLTSAYREGVNTDNYLAIAHTMFAVTRFLTVILGFFIKPRILLAIYVAGAAIFTGLCTHVRGDAAAAMIMLAYGCEGPIFSLIYAMSLRGMGRHTKDASALLTAAISGGAILPPIHHAFAKNSQVNMNSTGGTTGTTMSMAGDMPLPSYQKSYWVICTAWIICLCALPLWSNLSPLGRKHVDPIKRSQVVQRRTSSPEEEGKAIPSTTESLSSDRTARAEQHEEPPMPELHDPSGHMLSPDHPLNAVHVVDWQARRG